jgi:hypothetical protein
MVSRFGNAGFQFGGGAIGASVTACLLVFGVVANRSAMTDYVSIDGRWILRASCLPGFLVSRLAASLSSQACEKQLLRLSDQRKRRRPDEGVSGMLLSEDENPKTP